jgi:hypothetical protein
MNKVFFSPFDEVPRHMSAPLYCYTALAWLVFATVMASATAKATAMGIRRIGIATATATLPVMAMATATATAMATVMAMATATVMATGKAMVIEWQQLATVMLMVMPTA